MYLTLILDNNLCNCDVFLVTFILIPKPIRSKTNNRSLSIDLLLDWKLVKFYLNMRIDSYVKDILMALFCLGLPVANIINLPRRDRSETL